MRRMAILILTLYVRKSEKCPRSVWKATLADAAAGTSTLYQTNGMSGRSSSTANTDEVHYPLARVSLNTTYELRFPMKQTL